MAAASAMSTPPVDSEGGRREFVATISADKARRKPSVDFKTGAHIRAGLHLAQKFIDRARSEFMKRSGEATETEIGGRVAHFAPPCVAPQRASNAASARL